MQVKRPRRVNPYSAERVVFPCIQVVANVPSPVDDVDSPEDVHSLAPLQDIAWRSKIVERYGGWRGD